MMSIRNKTLNLLLASLLIASSLAHFEDEAPCHHDLIEHNPGFLDIGENMTPPSDRILQESASQSIRIYTHFDPLEKKASSSFAAYVKNELVPPIIDYFQGALKIKYPVAGGLLKLGSSVGTICEISTPSILKSGVNADFFMYYDIDTATSFVASAGYCYLASDSKRPIVARTKINSNKLFEPKGSVLEHEKNMYVMMHEMMHAMGFSNYLTKYYLDSNGKTRTGHIKTYSIAGSTRTVIDVPPLTEKLRNFYGCPSLQGAIMENEGGSGTALAHFERKYFVYETMSSGGIFGRRISEFSLAMLEGSGWYEVDYSYAEPFFYGQGQGCSFISSTCSSGSSQFDEYCTGSTKGCAPHGRGGGSCSSDPIMDGCKFIYPNEDNDCDNDDGADSARLPELQVFGRGAGSKCFTGTLNNRQSSSSSSKSSFCFKFTCVGNGSDTQVEVQVGNNKVTCTEEGTKTIDGYYGAVDCPDPLTFCNGPGKQYCPRNCMGRGSCVNNKCQCKSGYSGVDCALKA
jgi:leishmanolysin